MTGSLACVCCVQITNQMITSCKAYITHGGTETIWTQPTPQVLKRISECLKLYEEYRVSFQHMKQALKEASRELEGEASFATNGSGNGADGPLASRPQTGASSMFSARSALTSARQQRPTTPKVVELSGMYILGKFETFAKRLKRIVEMFNTSDVYGRVAVAKIEGQQLRV